jgi:hypothetical protein
MSPQQNQAAAQDHPDSFSTNEYKYIEHYDHFKRDTDEKLCAAMVAKILADKLRENGLVYHMPKQPIAVVDIGSGPADSIQLYLKGANHPGGFEIHVIDQNREYTGPDGAAHKSLRNARDLIIGDLNVVNGNAFDGNLTKNLKTRPHYFPLAFLSHVLYHTDREHLSTLLQDVSNNVLTKEGIGILFHLEGKQDSFQYFRHKYGRKYTQTAGVASSDTPAMEVDNPSEAVEEACKQLNIPCHTSHYTNRYYFMPMEDRYWEMFKHPERYSEITNKAARNNLHKLYFIVQRAPTEFATDHCGESGLSAFIGEVRKVIANVPGKCAQGGSFMELAETVQLIGSAQADDETREKLKAVSDAIQAELPHLAQMSFRQKWCEDTVTQQI